MLGKSRLLLGLLSETDDAATTEVELWDRSNVWQAAWDQAAKNQTVKNAGMVLRDKVAKPFADEVRDRLRELLPQPDEEADQSGLEHPLDRHLMKFCRLLDHAGLRINHTPTVVELHDLCLQIERDAVRSLREADDRSLSARLKREPRNGFDGTTTDDLVRHVIQKTFEQLDAEFRKKTPTEQEEIAARIAAALRDLSPEEQERIRKTARLPDLTAETLRQTGMLASLGFGVSGMVGLAGFTAYTTITSLVAAATGLVGLHLGFSTYMFLTWGLAWITNPLVFIPMVIGGGTWMTSRANRGIRGVLYPTLVATSVMANASTEERDLPVADFAKRIGSLAGEISTGSGERLGFLVSRFPGLGRPPIASRLMRHVTG